MAQHISLKFQNDTANEGFRLISAGLKLSKLPSRNVIGTNGKAVHISLRFRNNAASTPFQLETLGLGLFKLPEQ